MNEEISKNKKGKVVCIFSYWIYAGPGCIIVHLPLTTVGVCVDPDGGGQVCVDGNVQSLVCCGPFTLKSAPGILVHSRMKVSLVGPPMPASIDAVHVSSVGVAVCPPMVEGLHVAVGGVGCI